MAKPTVAEIIEFIDGEISAVNALPKKSNYHNARRAQSKRIRDFIDPPPPPEPKPEKEKKAPKPKKEAKPKAEPKASKPKKDRAVQGSGTGKVVDANTGETIDEPNDAGDTGAA